MTQQFQIEMLESIATPGFIGAVKDFFRGFIDGLMGK